MPNMQSWQKIGLLLLGAIGITIACVYLLVTSLLVPETVRIQIIPRLEEIIKRPVAYSQIRIGMGGSISIEDLSIAQGDPRQGTPLLTSPAMILHCQLLPLFSRKIIIDRIVLREPQIRLRRDADGDFNINSAGSALSGREGAVVEGTFSGPSQTPVIFTFDRLELHDGTLTFTDYWRRPAQPLATTCTGINAELSDFSAVSPFSATLSAECASTPPAPLKLKAVIDPVRKQVTSDIKLTDVEVTRIAPYLPDLPFSLTGGQCSLDLTLSVNSAFDFSSRGTVLLTKCGVTMKDTPAPQLMESLAELAGSSEIGVRHDLSYQASGDALEVKQCAVTLGRITVLLQGGIESLSTDPLCEITVATEEILAQTILDTLPPAALPAVKKLSSAGAAKASLTFKGHIKEPEALAMSGFLQMDDLFIQSDAAPRWNIKVGGKAELNNQEISISQLTATTGSSRLNLAGSLENCFAEPMKPVTARLRISSPSLDAEEVIACITGLGNLTKELWDEDEGAEKKGEPLVDPRNVRVSAEAAVDSIIYSNLRLSDLTASGRWSGSGFNLDSLRGVMGRGAFTASGRVGQGGEGLDYTCRLTGNLLEIAQVLECIAPGRKESISGIADLAFNLQSRGTTSDAVRRNLAGEGSFTIRDGKVTGFEFLESLSSFIKIDALNNLTFDESQGAFQVGDGEIHLQSSLKGKDMEIYPTGTIGLDSDLDLLLDVRLAPRLSDQIADGVLTRYFKDEKGWTMLSLSIKGPAGEAVVMPASSTIKNISEMLVDILLKKGDAPVSERDDKKKALEDLLQRLMQKSKDDEGREDTNHPAE